MDTKECHTSNIGTEREESALLEIARFIEILYESAIVLKERTRKLEGFMFGDLNKTIIKNEDDARNQSCFMDMAKYKLLVVKTVINEAEQLTRRLIGD